MAKEIAERLAEYIEAGSDARARVWAGQTGVVRVYVSRYLSRGRKQDIGYIEIDGSRVDYYATRTNSSFRTWAREAERMIAEVAQDA